MSDHPYDALHDDDVVLDDLPDELASTIEVRDAWIASLPASSTGMEFLVADLQRWTPGMRLRVAFLDGTTDLHRDIADATRQLTDACNIELDFGVDQPTGAHRRWTEDDTDHAAEIRVSFDQTGYWSLVGTDSTDQTIGSPAGTVGGHPWQRSLNLGGFTGHRPPTWQGTVRHEFMHALAFKHAHQNMRGPCQDEFRWDDDPRYTPTTDADGRYGPDAAGRRPGIYTYLAGYPNFWNSAKVDHNLRTADEQTSVAGRFDNASIMLYRFAPFFYRTDPSPCAPTGDGTSLSEEDKRGLRLLYPSTQPELAALAAQRHELQTVVAMDHPGPETAAAPGSAYARRIATALADSLDELG
jgi:hypothetical protein